jgi:hypothetical protein
MNNTECMQNKLPEIKALAKTLNIKISIKGSNNFVMKLSKQ